MYHYHIYSCYVVGIYLSKCMWRPAHDPRRSEALEALEPGPAFVVTEETSSWRRRRFLFSPHVCWHQMGNMGNKNPIDQGIYWCWYLQFIAGCSQFFDILSDGPQLPDIEKCWAEHQQPRMKQPRGLHCWAPLWGLVLDFYTYIYKGSTDHWVIHMYNIYA